MNENERLPAAQMSSAGRAEQDLIQEAREALSDCSFTVGRCAAEWTERYSKGRTDGDFGDLVGLSGDQVYMRRRVWETFEGSGLIRKLDEPAARMSSAGREENEPASLKFTHFYVALTWPDSIECLEWARDNEATVAEMKAWRRMQHGEDLTIDSDPEPTEELEEPSRPLPAAEDATSGDEGSPAVARSSEELCGQSKKDTELCGQSETEPATLDNPRDLKAERATTQKPHDPKGDEKLDDLKQERRRYQTTIRRLVKSHPSFRYLIADDLDHVAEQIRQGEDEIVGLDRQTFDASLKQAKESR